MPTDGGTAMCPTRLPIGPVTEPHARGSLLVAAVFDAFLAIYATRTADLYRIYTGGTGVLRPGAIHPDLVNRLANEAATSAGHVLRICIRALDYVPPVDVTFGEYLRALITADVDLVEDDPLGYRVAFVEAFRRRGIYPSDLSTLSVDTLVWQGADLGRAASHVRGILVQLKKFANDCLYIDDRHQLFKRTRKERISLHDSFREAAKAEPTVAKLIGIDPGTSFEIHELRRAERTAPDGSAHPQVILAVTQQREVKVEDRSMNFYGGAMLVIDLKQAELKYAIRKSIDNKQREEDTTAFFKSNLENPLTALLLDSERYDRFAILHALADLGN